MQEWSYIPVGGSLPNTEQKTLAFGAAASMVHPATGNTRRKYITLNVKKAQPGTLSSCYVRGLGKDWTTGVYCTQPYPAFLQEANSTA